MNPIFIGSAKRLLVSPRNERWRATAVSTLAAPVIRHLANLCEINDLPIDEVILGNALYGGGNPARLAALEAGLDESVFASTVDTQCCSGMDAILYAASKIASGRAHVIIAGGVESYSRSPIRQHRALSKSGEHVAYERPPFTPWPNRDPDLIEAAANFAAINKITRDEQAAFACISHRKAMSATFENELVSSSNEVRDDFSRNLKPSVCDRLPLLVGDPVFGLTSATVAVEADGAAAVLVLSEWACNRLSMTDALRMCSFRQAGGLADQPILAGLNAASSLIQDLGRELTVVEFMESFAAQAMVWARELRVEDDQLNRSGGALSRGHPIGASGAILIVRLFYELMKEPAETLGLAAIAAAGGLGSAALLQKC
jgi:acetyl-CoA C-acetyltransferase